MRNKGLVMAIALAAASEGIWTEPPKPWPKPKREKLLTEVDRQRLEAAEAKRTRKRAKRLAALAKGG